jgi:predicted regulator of Ras-like GTPase activity (Roadblock/LC7/MglB family)
MLDPILEGLREVDGVQGALVVDHTGAILAYRAHSIYDLPVLQKLARSIIAATDSVDLIQDDWEVMTTHFADGKLVIRRLRTPGARPRSYLLSVIADQTLNLAFLGVALRVAASKAIAALEAGPPPAAQTGPVPVVAPSSVSARISAVDPRRDVSQTIALPSAEGAPVAVPGTDVTAVDAPSAAFLSACLRALAARIGPVAKIYIRDTVRRVCPGRAFSRSDGPLLIAQLSAMLDSPEDRAMFQRAVRAL